MLKRYLVSRCSCAQDRKYHRSTSIRMHSPITAFKRVGKSNVTVMLTAKDSPKGWGSETLLCRFMEENGAETPFILQDGAMESFAHCEVGQLYDLEINGNCVKARQGPNKFGMPTLVEVRVKFPSKVKVSAATWSAAPVYKFAKWESLQEKESGEFVDIVGRVSETYKPEHAGSLQKMEVGFVFGDQELCVEFLGRHADVALRESDVVVLRGAVVKEWRNSRSVQTSHLTVITVNPASCESIPAVPELEEDGPKKKMMRSTLKTVEVGKLKEMMTALENDGPPTDIGAPPVGQDICVRGRLQEFTDAFFE